MLRIGVGQRVPPPRHPKRQIPALAAQQVVLAVFERIDAVVMHPRRAAPDQHIAVLQWQALHRIAAVQAAPQKSGRQAERHRDDGRCQVCLVLIAVQGQLGTGLVAVDQAGVGHKAGVAGGHEAANWPATPPRPAIAPSAATRWWCPWRRECCYSYVQTFRWHQKQELVAPVFKGLESFLTII